jgi:hypothetical protein
MLLPAIDQQPALKQLQLLLMHLMAYLPEGHVSHLDLAPFAWT